MPHSKSVHSPPQHQVNYLPLHIHALLHGFAKINTWLYLILISLWSVENVSVIIVNYYSMEINYCI